MRSHTRQSIIGRLRGLMLALALLLGPLLGLAATPAQAASGDCTTANGQTTCTFDYTGAAQTWTVPAEVTEATFDVYGAQGGSGPFATSIGGKGGHAKASLSVTPGAVYQITVGGRGGSVRFGQDPPGAGGFNGGGSGGSGFLTAGGGGGASDVRTGSFALTDRIIIAGGGGGAPYGLAFGGSGGGSEGGDGRGGGKGDNNGGGKGGSQTAGGAGGIGQGDGGGNGEDGSLGNGGAGSDHTAGGGTGAGGGGGYYGGGGGGGYFGGGGGGGGGSGYGPAGVVFETGVRSGDGQVIITYTSPDSTAPVITPSISSMAGNNGWYVSDVTVSWSVTDAESAISSQTGCDPSTVTSDTAGVTFTCTATSSGGTASKSVTIKRDATNPTVSYTGNAGTYTIDQSVSISCTAADNLSGVASSSCANISGPAYSFALGTNTRSASATDNAGNTGSGSTTFTVSVTYDSLCALSANFSTDPAVDKGLCDKLAAAKAAAASGDTTTKNNNLKAYRQQVAAQSGKAVTKQQATILSNLSKAL